MNVLVVLADQHQADCMGVEGHPQAITPQMDRMAAAGARFTNAYVQNPICTPSRVSILSGQYPHNHGCYGLAEDGNRRPLGLVHEPPGGLPSWLGHFRAHGYRTAAIGKIHTPGEPANWLDSHTDVFNEVYTYGGRPSLYFQDLETRGLLHLEEGTAGLPEAGWDGRPGLLGFDDSYEGWITRQAIQFIETTREQPFCMQVSYPRPHEITGHLYMAAPDFWDLYPDDLDPPASIHRDPAQRAPHFQAISRSFRRQEWTYRPNNYEAGCRRIWRAYLASISQVDHALGLLLDHLEQTGRLRDTIVLYSSDHGSYSTVYGLPEKQPGISSRRVCRVPQLWLVPGVTPPGHVVDVLVEAVDIAATLPGLAGLPPMPSVDGRDLSELLGGGGEPVRDLAVTENALSKAMHWQQWWFVHYPRRLFDGQDVGELYDLSQDPDETRNLYSEPSAAGVVAEARLNLLEWLNETGRVTSAIGWKVEDTALARELGAPPVLRPWR